MAGVEGELVSLEDIDDLLYVKFNGKYRGWKIGLLTENTSVIFVHCETCKGLMRDPNVYQADGLTEMRCFQCVPKKIIIKKQSIELTNRVNQKLVSYNLCIS